jgi:NAD-dependent deacetylase
LEEYLQAFQGVLASSRKTLAFTGAGVSLESGIPTFRGKGGIWEQYPPSVYGNLPGLAAVFLLRGKRLAGFAAEIVSLLVEASPNPCHCALARMEPSRPCGEREGFGTAWKRLPAEVRTLPFGAQG